MWHSGGHAEEGGGAHKHLWSGQHPGQTGRPPVRRIRHHKTGRVRQQGTWQIIRRRKGTKFNLPDPGFSQVSEDSSKPPKFEPAVIFSEK